MKSAFLPLVALLSLLACSRDAVEDSGKGIVSEKSQATRTTTKPEPASDTKIEALAKKKGRTIILGYSEIGSLKTLYGGSISVEAREYWDATQPRDRNYGVRIELKEASSYSRESASFVDYEEIDALLEGISVISRIDSSITSFRFYEARYVSRGGLKVVVFNTRQGKTAAGISSGSVDVQTSIEQMETFRSLIVQAKAFLNSAKEKAPK